MAFGSDPSPGDEFAPLADINVTPFIDVMLVLLIIFMVTAPLLTAGMKVELPQARSSQPLEPVQPVVVTVGPDGRLQVGDRDVARDGLVGLVRETLGGGADRHIQVRGDAKADFGAIVSVLDLLASNGLTRIALVTQRPTAPAATR
ncbi:ExbD/TolR family protein [Phreatobacter stygius]|uniref:Biopolymer transporter ExbD n=1 Tax=Phreatobacter stygius TaxID=1940610 RepID=A0A4D7B093_9HYPH|nr:biopolymer transporter ExbD [Phreatobacter stygius]QCI67049.1 biopolymer transporter ExbD [Phreatobacter stygius]